MRTSYYVYLHMRINYNYGSYSRKCHKKFGLPQNDIGVSSGRVSLLNIPTNHANLKAPPNPHSESTAPGMLSPGPYNSKYLDPPEPIFQSYTEIYGPLLNDRSPLSASMDIMIVDYFYCTHLCSIPSLCFTILLIQFEGINTIAI